MNRWVRWIVLGVRMVLLPLTLAYVGWSAGQAWHPVLAIAPCGPPTVIWVGMCHVPRPFWTRPEGLTLIGAGVGVVILGMIAAADYSGVFAGLGRLVRPLRRAPSTW
jgi:hypothetical protein